MGRYGEKELQTLSEIRKRGRRKQERKKKKKERAIHGLEEIRTYCSFP